MSEDNNLTLNSKQIIAAVQVIAENSDSTIIDAIIHYATVNDLEIETVAEIVRRSPKLKAVVKEAAIEVNMVRE